MVAGRERPHMGEHGRSEWSDVDGAADAAAYRSYLDEATGVDAVEAAKRRSRRLLGATPGDRLLDVGCGTGGDVRALADAVGSGGAVVGVDRSAAMAVTAAGRTRSGRAAFALADAGRLPFDAGAFDGARTDRVLQHLPDPGAAFRELVRVTRPGGRVVATEPDWGSLVVTAPGTDPGRTRRFLDPEWSCARNGRVGRSLRRWETGLDGATVETATLTFAGFDSANGILGFEGRAERLAEADAAPAGVAERWLQSLRRADREGGFLASLTLYTVAGTVPESDD